MTHRETALEYLRRFAAGDIDGLESLLSEDLQLVGPYLQVLSRAAYLEALHRDPPETCGMRILNVSTSDDSVAVFYEYQKRGAPLTIAQLFRFRDQQIQEIRLVFDGRESA